MPEAFLTDLDSGRVYTLKPTTKLGSLPDNDIVVARPSVSGHHMVIQNKDDAWFSQERQSSGPLPSAGSQVRLKEGDVIRLGDRRLRFSEKRPGAEPAPTKAGEPGKPETDPASKKEEEPGKKKKKTVLIIVGIALLVALIPGIWAASSLSAHTKGKKFLEARDYPAAIALFEQDSLFSKDALVQARLEAGEDALSREDYPAAIAYFEALGDAERLTEANRLAGEAAFAQQDYQTAAAYFDAMGDAGKERWADAVYEGAMTPLAKGKTDEAIQELERLLPEDRAQEKIYDIYLQKARKLVEDGKIDEALTIAFSLPGSRAAEVDEFLDWAYFTHGHKLFVKGDYQNALRAFQKCKNTPHAATNIDILEMLYNGEYLDAVALIDASVQSGATDIPQDKWRKAVLAFLDKNEDRGLDAVLQREYVKKQLSSPTDFSSDATEKQVYAQFGKGSAIDGVSGPVKGQTISVESLDWLYANCGKHPDGKILIAARYCMYEDHESRCVVLPDLMKLLPAEYYPSSLEEVEYLVLISYDFEKYGYYTRGTVAVREFGSVRVYGLPSRSQIYNSHTIHGDEPPSSFTYSYVPPEYYSGKIPAFGEEVYKALCSIIK